MFRLPVSGLRLDVRPPGGADDLMLLEAPVLDRAFALALLERLSEGAKVETLCIHDFEAALLHLHSRMFGPSISAGAHCRCGERVDIAFRSADFLRHRAPKRPRNLTARDGEGWYGIGGEAAQFRLPTIGDQIAVATEADPAKALAARCVRGGIATARIERAMAALAPVLSGPIEGRCPHCGEVLTVKFDIPSFVLGELRVQASQVCEHVHVLAAHYHWGEKEILALPNWRRQHYVDMAVAERGGG